MKKVIRRWTMPLAGVIFALACMLGGLSTVARAQSPSWLSNAVIYCVQPEIFSTGGIKGVTAQLPRLQKLGVNVIWLMPIYPRGNPVTVGGVARPSFGSPYDIENFEGIDPAEGTGSDLTNLITQAHALGMKVILDVALNCTSWDNPLITQHPEYYIHTDGNTSNLASIQTGWGTENDVAQLNLTGSAAAQSYVQGVCTWWLQNYGFDGFRFDSADNPTGATRSFPQSLAQSIRTAMNGVNSNTLMLEEGENFNLATAPYGLDYGWNQWYYGVDSAFGQNGGAYTLQYQNTYPYTSSNIAPAGMLTMNIQDDWDLANRDIITLGGTAQAMAAAVFNFTINGVPLVYNGMEVANETPGSNPHTQIDWTNSNAYNFQTFYQQLIALRNNSGGALQQGTTTWVANSSNNQISTYDRTGGGQEYLIEINTSASSFSGTVSAPAGGAWIEVTPAGAPGGQNHVNPGTGNLSLAGWDFAIFKRSSAGQPAATPSFSLTPGTYTGNQSLTISDATSGATIYYTTDGTTPTTSSPKYTGPITLTTVETVQAMAVGAAQSSIRSGQYNIYSGTGGSLTGSVTPITSATSVNLTSQGSSDWAMWGYQASFNFEHKSTGNGQISNLGVYSGGGEGQFTNSLVTASWTDGSPDGSVGGTTNGYYNGGGVGDGFVFTVPADANTRTLTVYVGGWQSGGTLTASLSDNSAAVYTNSTLSNSSTNYYGSYTITYKAANPNQTLTVKWIQASGTGNVTIQAATLQGNAVPTAATPTFSPAAGTYSSAQSVTISDTTSGATIHYTTDGSTPTSSSPTYTGPISVSSTETVNAIAVASGYNNSAVGSAAYTIVTVPAAPALNSATAGNTQVALSWTASSGATSYNVYRGTSSGGESGTPVATGITGTTYTNTGLTDGTTYYFKVAAVNQAGTSGLSNEKSATPVAPTEGPYGGTPWAIPGTVYADAYDTGGSGLGYSVSSVNGSDNGWRTTGDGVDLEACSDSTNNGADVGWSAAGQWFRYTVNVSTAGSYQVTMRVADGGSAAGSFHIQNSSGTNLTGAITVPTTGGWQTWTSVTASLTLPAGQQVLTVYQDSANFNLNSMTFASQNIPGAPTLNSATAANTQVTLSWSASSGATTYNVYRGTSSGGESGTPVATGITGTSYTNTGLTDGTTYYFKVAAVNGAGTSGLSNEKSATPSNTEAPYGGSAWAIPGTLYADDYDTGGSGVAYSVGSVNGTDNGWRTTGDGVDLEACSDGTTNGASMGWSNTGQWFKYTVNVSTAGTYNVACRVASGASGGSFHIQNASGTNLSGSIGVPGTGGWQTWTTVNATVTLPAGQQVLTVYQDSNNVNINYLKFSLGSLSGSPTNVGSATAFNLTTQGTTDWAAWGFNGTDRDSSGGSKIGTLSVAGAGSLNSFTSSFLGFTWTNGTPDASETNETKGYYNNAGVNDGFQFTVPASPTVQHLTVYVGGWSSGGTLRATLSDGSAASYTDSSMVNTGNSYYGYYTLNYSAASANQTLTVTWKQNQGTGNVTVYAAALH